MYLFTMYVLTFLFLYWLGSFCLLILTAGLIVFDSYTVECKLNRIHSYQCFSWWGLFAVHFLRNRICTGLSLGGLSTKVTHLHSPPKCHGDEHPSTEPDVRVHGHFLHRCRHTMSDYVTAYLYEWTCLAMFNLFVLVLGCESFKHLEVWLGQSWKHHQHIRHSRWH